MHRKKPQTANTPGVLLTGEDIEHRPGETKIIYTIVSFLAYQSSSKYT